MKHSHLIVLGVCLIVLIIMGFVLRGPLTNFASSLPWVGDLFAPELVETANFEDLDNLQILVREGQVEGVSEQLERIIEDAQDPIVRERAIRDKIHIDNSDDILQTVAAQLQIANDTTIRPEARAGAIESIAQTYLNNDIDVNTINDLVFADAPLSEVTVSDASSHGAVMLALLRYGDTVSPRAFTTAQILDLLSQRAYQTILQDTNGVIDFDEVTLYLEQLENLLPAVADTNPNKPRMHAHQARALLYMHEAGQAELVSAFGQPVDALSDAVSAAVAWQQGVADMAQGIEDQTERATLMESVIATHPGATAEYQYDLVQNAADQITVDGQNGPATAAVKAYNLPN